MYSPPLLLDAGISPSCQNSEKRQDKRHRTWHKIFKSPSQYLWTSELQYSCFPVADSWLHHRLYKLSQNPFSVFFFFYPESCYKLGFIICNQNNTPYKNHWNIWMSSLCPVKCTHSFSGVGVLITHTHTHTHASSQEITCSLNDNVIYLIHSHTVHSGPLVSIAFAYKIWEKCTWFSQCWLSYLLP